MASVARSHVHLSVKAHRYTCAMWIRESLQNLLGLTRKSHLAWPTWQIAFRSPASSMKH